MENREEALNSAASEVPAEGQVPETQVTPPSPEGQAVPEVPLQTGPTPADDIPPELAEAIANANGAPAPGGAKVPRALPEIEAEYGELVKMIGEAYCQREFHDRNIKQMILRHAQLTGEGQRRMALDQAAADSKLKAAEEKRARKAPKLEAVPAPAAESPAK